MQEITHDRLLYEAYTWLWNTHPETRYTMFHVTNETKPYPGETQKQLSIRIAKQRSIGLLPGVTDLIWYWRGKLIALDAKVGNDRLSREQRHFIETVEKNGGAGYEFRSLDDFKYICKKYL